MAKELKIHGYREVDNREVKIYGYRKGEHKAILDMIPNSFDGFSGYVFDGDNNGTDNNNNT